MTVDESQMSAATTASTAAPGTPKSKASIVNTPSSKSPLPAQGQFQQPEAVSSPRSTQAPMDHGSFDAYAQANPAKADELIAKLIEVTGTTDRGILIRALEQSKKTDQNHEFNVTCAIEWILSMSERQSNDHQRPRRKPPGQSQFASPGGANATNNHSFAPMQPPNSPSSTAAVASGENAELRSATNMPLVDLTDSSNDVNNKDDGDADLEKAIALSLQEHKRNDGPNFGVSQEDQDVSRALEASLMETQSSKRSRGMIDYVDPLNPHDRQRKEMVSGQFLPFLHSFHSLHFLFTVASGLEECRPNLLVFSCDPILILFASLSISCPELSATSKPRGRETAGVWQ